MKRLAALAAVAALGLALVLTGCVQRGQDETDRYARYVEVQTPQGTIPCIVLYNSIDCGWP